VRCSTLVNRILVYNNTALPVLSRPTSHLTITDSAAELTTDQRRLVVRIERAPLKQRTINFVVPLISPDLFCGLSSGLSLERTFAEL